MSFGYPWTLPAAYTHRLRYMLCLSGLMSMGGCSGERKRMTKDQLIKMFQDSPAPGDTPCYVSGDFADGCLDHSPVYDISFRDEGERCVGIMKPDGLLLSNVGFKGLIIHCLDD